jgi:hypothetical protein
MRTATSGKPTVEALMPLAPHDATAATRFLELALDLRLRAMREPIPLFEFSRTSPATRCSTTTCSSTT